MQKRVFIVHGWDGYPEEGWFPWLKRELEKNDFQVFVPAMPESEEPKIEPWVSHLAELVGTVDQNTFFVGHSIGCQTILRYLERLPSDKKIGGVVFVAGWFTLTNSNTDEEIRIRKPWVETPVNFEKIKQHGNKFVALFSDDDPVVPLSNQDVFREKLGAKIIIEHQKGHFGGSDNVLELPSALHAVLDMTK